MHTNNAETSLKRYKYNGKERDEETNLDYYGARYYASWLCRFVSVDPLKDNYPFQNSFAYAANSPVTMTDVNGEGPSGGVEEDGTEKKFTPFVQLFRTGEHKKNKTLGVAVFTSKTSFTFRNDFMANVTRNSLKKPYLDLREVEKNIKNYDNASKVAGLGDDKYGSFRGGSFLNLVSFTAGIYFEAKETAWRFEKDDLMKSFFDRKNTIESANLSVELGKWLEKSFEIALENKVFEGINPENISDDFILDVVNYGLIYLSGNKELLSEQRYLNKPESLSNTDYQNLLGSFFATLMTDVYQDKYDNSARVISFEVGDRLIQINKDKTIQRYENIPTEAEQNYVSP